MTTPYYAERFSTCDTHTATCRSLTHYTHTNMRGYMYIIIVHVYKTDNDMMHAITLYTVSIRHFMVATTQ